MPKLGWFVVKVIKPKCSKTIFQWNQQNCWMQAHFNWAEILYESCEKFHLPIAVVSRLDDRGSFY